MTQSPGRAAVFLGEMGIGPVWSLRCGTPAGQAEQTEPVLSVAPAPALSEEPAPAAAQRVPLRPPASLPAAAAGDASPACLDDVPLPVPVPVTASPAQAGDASTAWFDDAPPPVAPAPVSDAALALMDWNELKAAAASCTRCDLCQGRKRSVFGRGATAAGWLLVGSGPGRADEKEGQPVSGDAGTLLDNMLQAIGLAPARDVYVTNLVKCRAQDGAGFERPPSALEVAACRPYLERELALTQAQIILTLGQPALKGLLGKGARGTVHRLGATPVVATAHPDALLVQGQAHERAKAWADLCLARQTHDTHAAIG